MKILMFFPYISNYDLLLDNYPAYVSKLKHEVTVVSYPLIGVPVNPERLLSNIGLRYIQYEGFNLRIPYLVDTQPVASNLESLFASIDPDVVHVNNLPFVASYQATKAAKKLNIPVVFHVHGVSVKRGRLLDGLQGLFLKTISRELFEGVDRFICLTTSDSEELVKAGCNPGKIRIIPNSIDNTLFSPAADGARERFIFAGGRFVSEKGFTYLIEALELVEDLDVTLAMAGVGPLLEIYKKKVSKQGLEKRISFLGMVPHGSMPYYYRRCAVYALPSIKEGMPFSLLEAMACGTPVVASDIAGVKENMASGLEGILVPPGDPAALAEAMTLLIDNPEYAKRLGEMARERILRDHDPEAQAREIVNVYADVIGNR